MNFVEVGRKTLIKRYKPLTEEVELAIRSSRSDRWRSIDFDDLIWGLCWSFDLDKPTELTSWSIIAWVPSDKKNPVYGRADFHKSAKSGWSKFGRERLCQKK